MPRMRGTRLAAEIRASWPELPLILATGDAELPKNGELKLPLLHEPYAQDDLAAAIVDLLGAGAATSARSGASTAWRATGTNGAGLAQRCSNAPGCPMGRRARF
ncbi:MAG: hypothetical protein ACREIR_03300 [Geminicoccaceae bacterium]